MLISTPPPAAAGSAADTAALVEAARYALLRRLAHALRHDMVAHLQPINMVGEVLSRRMAAPQPDLAQLRASVDKILGLTRTAVEACLDTIGWLAPDPAQTTPLDAGAREVLGLLRGSLALTGFTLRDELGAAPASVSQAALRQVLPAALLLLTDHAGAPAEVAVRAGASGGRAWLELDLQPEDGPAPPDVPLRYRRLARAEVQALAHAQGASLREDGDMLRIEMPLAAAA